MTNSKRISGYAAALGYAAIIGFSFIFVKDILAHADVIDVLMFRFALSFFPLLLAYPFVKRRCNFSKERVLILMKLGIFYPLLFFGAQTFALSIASSIEIGAVQATAPVFTLILATLILKEKTNYLQKLSVLICVGGVLYIMLMKFIKNTAPDFRGLGIAFISTISFAVYTVLAKKHKKNYNNYEILFVLLAEGFVITFIASMFKNISHGTLSSLMEPWKHREFVIGILYLSVLSTLLSGHLINYALANIDASKMVVFNNLGTVIQILAGVIIIHETLYPSHIIGSIMIILGLLGVNLLGQVDDVKNYVPIFWIIMSVLSFITGVFTFFMGTQNIAHYYTGTGSISSLSDVELAHANIGSNYAIAFFIVTLVFAILGVGFAMLYYLSSKRLAALKLNEGIGRVSYPQFPKESVE